MLKKCLKVCPRAKVIFHLIVNSFRGAFFFFIAQFSDPQLREQFNLVAIDQRSYGDTTGPVDLADKGYTPKTAAHDAFMFIVRQMPDSLVSFVSRNKL